MCGRYDFFPGEFSDLRIRFNLDKDLPAFQPSYNIAPGKDVPVIIRDGDRNVVKLMRWGLVPSWSQDPPIGNQMINARCETLDQKPSFKQLLGTALPDTCRWFLRMGASGKRQNPDARENEGPAAFHVRGIMGRVARSRRGGTLQVHHHHHGSE